MTSPLQDPRFTPSSLPNPLWVDPTRSSTFRRERPQRASLGNQSAPHLHGPDGCLAGGSLAAPPPPQALYLDRSRPEGLEELLSAPPPDLGAQRCHGWNPKDCSENIEVKEGGLCFERPVAQSTDGARGKRGYSRACTPGRSAGPGNRGAPTPWWAWPQPTRPAAG